MNPSIENKLAEIFNFASSKVAVIRNPNKTCGILSFAPSLFNPASKERCEIRLKKIDFVDAKLFEEFSVLNALISALKINLDLLENATEEKDIAELKEQIAGIEEATFAQLDLILENKSLIEEAAASISDWICAKDIKSLPYRITDKINLPDYFFRDAFHDENLKTEAVEIDLDRAKEIKKNHLRALRKPLLEALDIEFTKALGQEKDFTAIEKKRQELRNVTKLKLPDDLVELKNFSPPILQ